MRIEEIILDVFSYEKLFLYNSNLCWKSVLITLAFLDFDPLTVFVYKIFSAHFMTETETGVIHLVAPQRLVFSVCFHNNRVKHHHCLKPPMPDEPDMRQNNRLSYTKCFLFFSCCVH